MSIFFSIVIPVFNTEKYISQCLNSILNQSYSNFEVIIINDGSIDKSEQICIKYVEMYPKIIRLINQNNSGALTSRLKGVVEANGDYCIFVDSDDILEENCLETLKNIIIYNTNVDMIIYNFCFLYEKNQKKKFIKPLFSDTKITKEKVYEKAISTIWLNSMCTKAIRTAILKSDITDYSVFENRTYGEDFLQSLYQITMSKEIYYCSQPLYYYRIHSSNVTRKIDIKSIHKRYNQELLQQLFQYMKVWGMTKTQDYELYYSRCLKEISWTFIECFRNIKSFKQKKECINIQWESIINTEALKYMNSKHLSLSHKIRLFLLFRKKVILLIIYDRFCYIFRKY